MDTSLAVFREAEKNDDRNQNVSSLKFTRQVTKYRKSKEIIWFSFCEQFPVANELDASNVSRSLCLDFFLATKKTSDEETLDLRRNNEI